MKTLYLCDRCARILPPDKITAVTGSKMTGYFCKKCLRWLMDGRTGKKGGTDGR